MNSPQRPIYQNQEQVQKALHWVEFVPVQSYKHLKNVRMVDTVETNIQHLQSSYATERIRICLVYIRVMTAKLATLTHRENVM